MAQEYTFWLEKKQPPTISLYEREQARVVVEKYKLSRNRNFSNTEVLALATYVAKHHLQLLYNSIQASKACKFRVDFFCDKLRLWECFPGERTIIAELSNSIFAFNPIYKAKYASIVDPYFESPIVERSWNAFCYPQEFVVI